MSLEKAGVTSREIEQTLRKGQKRIEMLTMRPLLLMESRIENNQEYLKVHTIQRWKQWLKTKKQWRSKVEYCNNMLKSQETGRENLFKSFKTWKSIFEKKKDQFTKISYQNLQERSISVTNLSQSVKIMNTHQDETIYELEHQNKILVENTISGQKMALLTFQDKYNSIQKRISKTQNSSQFQLQKSFN